MPSALFAAEILDATAAVDAVLAEGWLLKPMIEAAERTAPSIPDPSRPQVTFQAIFFDPEARPDLPNSYDRRQVRRAGEKTAHPKIMVSPAAIAAAAGLVIHQGDLLVRQADGIAWRVADTFEMASGAFKIDLNIVG